MEFSTMMKTDTMKTATEPLSAAYRRARAKLIGAIPDTDTAGLALEARELASFAAGIDRNRFFLAGDAPVDTEKLDDLLARRIAGEPLAYLLGEWDFCGRRFLTDRRALIPRDDSMAVLELFLELLADHAEPLSLLDLCTGTGCLGISAVAELADRGRPARAVLADLSTEALSLACENVALHGLDAQIECVRADAFAVEMLSNYRFDGCICNPPYIKSAIVPTLDRSVAAFEPHMALDGGTDGLDFYRAIISSAPAVLYPGGVLAFEVGFDQAEAVGALFHANEYVDITVKNDLQNVPRAVAARVGRIKS